MRWVMGSSVLVSLALVGCVGSTRTVEVKIAPDAYQVGAVTSALATPAVDEVVRIDPRRVLMVTCRATPPRKIIQFEVELKARHPAELQLTFSEDCPA